MVRHLIFCIVVSAISTNLFAQQTSSDNANITAGVIIPISITKLTDMNFGNLSVGGTGGTVIWNPSTGVRSVSPGSGITLPTTSGSPTLASFTVSGQANYGYSITLPTTPITLDDGAAHTMTVSGFTSSPSASGTLSAGTSYGTQTLYVGATLNVAPNQAAGIYTSTVPFTVVVSYN